MRINRTTKLSLIVTAIGWLSGCGIDRGGIDTINPLDMVPKYSGGTVAGKIEQLDISGSTVVINGVQLDLSSTSIVVNGLSANPSDLINGMYAVTLSGTTMPLTEPLELRVDYNAAGGVLDYDPQANTYELFGQEILLENLQNNAAPQNPLPGPGLQSVAVSGYVTSNNSIDVTAISTYDAGSPFFVSGYAAQIDNDNFTFAIGAQPYSYSNAVSITTNDGMLAELSRVRLQLAPGDTDGALNVLTIDNAPLIDATLESNAQIVLAGYVTDVVDSTSFSVSFVHMSTNTNTTFANFSAADIALDRLVRIDGTLQSDRTVLISTVTFLD